MARQHGAPLAANTSMQIQGDVGPFTMYTRRGGNVVWFPRSPPTAPPTIFQQSQRNRLILIAQDWQALTPEEKAAWSAMATKPRTWMTGYNLYVVSAMQPIMAQYLPTLQRQAGLPSLPPYTPR